MTRSRSRTARFSSTMMIFLRATARLSRSGCVAARALSRRRILVQRAVHHVATLEQDLDAPLGCVQDLRAPTGEANPLLEDAERLLEPQVAALQPLHHAAQ